MKIPVALLIGMMSVGTLDAAEPVSYIRKVRPFLARYCIECHNAREAKGDLDLETYKALMAGGAHGVVVEAGKADASRIVRLVEGKSKPAMPPRKALQPGPGEVGVLRRWIDSGAKDDSTATAVVLLPAIQPVTKVPPPVTAAAYRPDGRVLAAGLNDAVMVFDAATGDLLRSLPGQAGKVTALAYSRDGARLAVASGSAGGSGEVRVYADNGPRPIYEITAHGDLIYDAAFSPDGGLLATCGYDRLVRLWDTATGKQVRTLKDHSDAVYALAFRPDGKMLATAAADRSVKIWDVATGTRRHTLGESTDWLYTVAWSPDGRSVAAGGVDRSIRVWEVTNERARLRQSVFAHEGAIVRLLYSNDGKTLFSVGEDRVIKSWDPEHLAERATFAPLTDAALAMALRSDGGQLAIGRFDGVLSLLDPKTGKVLSEPIPIKPKPAILARAVPDAVMRGATVRLRLSGKHLTGVTSLSAPIPGFRAELRPVDAPSLLEADVSVPATAVPGVYSLSVTGPAGQSNSLSLFVDAFALVGEDHLPHASPGAGQLLKLPASVVGTIARAGETDWYRFEAKAGDEIGAQVLRAAGSDLQAGLFLADANGTILLESDNGLLGYRCDRTGNFALGVRDRSFRGGPAMSYRLHVGDLPIATGIFPLGVRRGTDSDVRVIGVNLGPNPLAPIRVAKDAALGSRIPVSIRTPQGFMLGSQAAVVGEFAEVREGDTVAVPGTANGIVDGGRANPAWRFTANKGQRLLLEVEANRLGSPLDSTLEILDAHDRPLPRAVLRCLSKTYVALRDHDSATTGIRIETWSDLAINDFVLLGGELARIFELPRNPDDDCRFFGDRGQRIAFLGTTPIHHSLGEPIYKVGIYPAETKFPANGLPLVTLYHRNDDGGPGFGRDSFLTFDPPADGEYHVRVGDARGLAGSRFAYRLTIRPPRPDFSISFSPTEPGVARGSGRALSLTARRVDGFEGPIALHFEGLPPGFSAPDTAIPAGENSTSLALYCNADAVLPPNPAPLKLMARAAIDGKEIVREAIGATPHIEPAGDLLASTDQQALTIRPGDEARITVTIERRNGHSARVPLEVRGLPHGVRVLDVGLNGILITERETKRTVVLYAEPWVTPMNHQFVVVARSERKGTEHAARSVLLTVAKPN